MRPAKARKERPKATHHLNGSAQLPREELAQPRTNGKANRIEGLEFDDEITISTKVDAIVKGVLHPGDIGVLYGPSGVGKTFAAIDLAYHIARGQA